MNSYELVATIFSPRNKMPASLSTSIYVQEQIDRLGSWKLECSADLTLLVNQSSFQAKRNQSRTTIERKLEGRKGWISCPPLR